MRLLLLSLIALLPLCAEQGVNIRGTANGTYTVLAVSTFTSRTHFRAELRIRGDGVNPFCNSGANGYIFTAGSLALSCYAADTFIWNNGRDSYGVQFPTPAIGTIFTLRLQWDGDDSLTSGQSGCMYVEMIDETTGEEIKLSDGQSLACSAGGTAAYNISGGQLIGDNSTKVGYVYIDWMRWYPTLVVPNSNTPPLRTTASPIAAWDFDGNGTESSGVCSCDVTIATTYPSTGVENPTAVPRWADSPAWMKGLSVGGVPTNQTLSLTGAASISHAATTALTCAWTQTAGPVTATITTPSNCTTTVTGITTFGQYTFHLVVTDTAANTDSADLLVGAVPQSAAGVVDLASINSEVVSIFYPGLIAWGHASIPWPEFQQREYADGIQGTLTPYDGYSTPMTGTIAVTGTAVVGSGTNFQTDFCSGGSSPAHDIVLFHTRTIGSGQGYSGQKIASCNSATSITLSHAWPQTALPAGTSYSRTDPGTWNGGSDNYNYYGGADLAACSLYYRSGLTAYGDDCDNRADKWWNSPYINGGNFAVTGSNLDTTFHPKEMALFGALVSFSKRGIVTAALPGLRALINPLMYVSGSTFDDLREDGYRMAYDAQLWRIDVANRATYLASIQAWIDAVWTPLLQSEPFTSAGPYPSFQCSFCLLNGYSWLGLAHPVNGSSTVTFTGSTLTTGAGQIGGTNANPIVWFASNSSYTAGDAVSYHFTVDSDTQITLRDSAGVATPYLGVSNASQYTQFSNLVGPGGAQPFIVALSATLLETAYQTGIGIAALHTYSAKMLQYVYDYGYQSSTKGTYYGRGFLNAEALGSPPPDGILNVSGDSTVAADVGAYRYYSGEVIRGMAIHYVNTGSSAVRTRLETMFAASLGGYYPGHSSAPYWASGGTLTDSKYPYELHETCPYNWSVVTSIGNKCIKVKSPGFWWGVGNTPSASAVLALPLSLGGASAFGGGVIFGGGQIH